MFHHDHKFTALAVIATIPIFLWELSLGIWLVAKGFTPSPILNQSEGRPTFGANPLVTNQ